MRSRVFVSCGQGDPKERQAAEAVCRLLTSRGFDPYLAIDVQTIQEINGGIIRELKNCDCFLFVNFCRERLTESEHRGSLFSNQEMAIAYSLGFDHFVVVNQKGIHREGMLAYIAVNTEEFDGFENCCAAVERALDRTRWTADYSRRLVAGSLRFNTTSYGHLNGRFLYLDICNKRPDIAAVETTARLAEIAKFGENSHPCLIRSPLKTTGRPGFRHTIFPKSHEAFDLLCVGTWDGRTDGVYLNCALDGEDAWVAQFRENSEDYRALAKEALEEHRRGETRPLAELEDLSLRGRRP